MKKVIIWVPKGIRGAKIDCSKRGINVLAFIPNLLGRIKGQVNINYNGVGYTFVINDEDKKFLFPLWRSISKERKDFLLDFLNRSQSV